MLSPEEQFAADLELAGSERGVDRGWYLATYPDVAAAGVDPVEHYLKLGWQEGRDPRPDFSTEAYLGHNVDTALNPLVHYLRRQLSGELTESRLSPWHELRDKGLFLPRLGHEAPDGVNFGLPGVAKVLMVGHEASRSGAPLILLRLIEALHSLTGVEVFLFLERGGPLLEDYRRLAHVLVNTKGLLYEPEALRLNALLGALAGPPPSLAISNSADSWLLVRALRTAGVPHVVSLVHERLLRYPGMVCQSVLRNADSVVFPALAVQQAAVAAHPSFEDSIVLPQGLLDPQFGSGDRVAARQLVRRQLGIAEDAAIVLGCGAWHLRKGNDLFVQLAARVRSRTSQPVHFVWLGTRGEDVQYAEFIAADVASLGLISSFSLVDEVANPEPYFLAADVFVLTSRDDPFPCVVHEAMACALPVVTFDGSGGAPEALADECGIVVPYLDVEAMADSVTSIASTPWRYSAMGLRAQARVRTTYRFADYAERLLQVCESVTQQPMPRLVKTAADAVPTPTPTASPALRAPSSKRVRLSALRDHLGHVIRSEQWWVHKLVPMVSVFYATTLVSGRSIASAWESVLLLLLAIAVCAAYVSLVNDVTDKADDLGAGKSNRMLGRPLWQTSALLGIPVLIGVAIGVIWRGNLALIGAYLGSWLAFSLYSIAPFRLKRRGVFGVLADASGAHLFPALTASLVALRSAGLPLRPVWLAAVATWALGLGLRGILWHELFDEDADRASGVPTFVVRRSRLAAVRLARVAFILELGGLATLLWQLWYPAPIAAVALYAAFAITKARLWRVNFVLAEPRDRYVILGQELYLALLPCAFLIASAVRFPWDWAVLGSHVLLFGQPVGALAREAYALARSPRQQPSEPRGTPAEAAAVVDAAVAFLRQRLHAGQYGLDALGSDGTPRFPDDHGHVFVAAALVEAIVDRLDEIDRTIVLTRILSEEQDGLWGYQSPGLIVSEETLPFLVDSDDSAYVIRTLHRLGVNRQPQSLMRFYREAEQLFVTWDTPGSPMLTVDVALENNFQAHPEVNANIYLALRGSRFEGCANYDALLRAQDEKGFWRSFFYPSRLFATLLVLDLTTDMPTFASARARAVSYVASAQNPDGSWGIVADPYETSLAVAALAGHPEHQAALDRGVGFLLSSAAPDGSWASSSCIWQSYWTESDLWRGYDSHRTFITARCVIALRRALAR